MGGARAASATLPVGALIADGLAKLVAIRQRRPAQPAGGTRRAPKEAPAAILLSWVRAKSACAREALGPAQLALPNVPDEGGNQRSSTVINGHQRSSAPLVPPRNQRQSALINGHQRSSALISSTRTSSQSEAMSAHQRPSLPSRRIPHAIQPDALQARSRRNPDAIKAPSG